MASTFITSAKANPILRSSIIIGLIALLTKCLGYIEKVVLAFYFGTSSQVDVYNVVTAIIISVFIFFREIVEPGFLNAFLRAISLKDETGAWNIFNFFVKYIFIITVALSVVVYAWPQYVVDLFAPGFGQQEKQLATNLIRIAFPATIFLSISTLTNITLNGLKKFALPASSELVYKFFILLCVFLLYKSHGIYAAIIGILIGSAFKLLVHFMMLFKFLSFSSSVDKGYLRDTWILSWPLLIGVAFSQISTLTDNIFASYMQEGAISALSYAKKLVELPVIIFPYILSVVVFPYFSEMSLAREKEKMTTLLSQCLSWITVIFLPLSIFFCFFSYEIVELIFKRGAFDESSTILTATPLALYSIGMVFFAIETVLVIFYYANSNTKTPIFIGIICVVENILLTFIFMKLLGYSGIALALVISKGTKNLVLLVLLRNKIIIKYHLVTQFLYKVIFSGILAGVSFLVVKSLFHSSFQSTILTKAIFLVLTFLFGAAIYTVILLLLKVQKRLISK